MPIAGAEGCYVWDYDGKRYLDFSSQLVYTNIGHQHPKVVAAIKAQADRLCTISPHHANDKRGEAARLISELAPTGLDKVLFTTGGGEAVEHAARMARVHTGRIKLMSTYRSYHGSTTTATHLTGDPRRWANDYGSAGVVHFFGPFLYRSPFHSANEEQESQRALEHLEQAIILEGSSTIAGIILETIPGTAGIMPPPPGYLAGVRELCDRYGIVHDPRRGDGRLRPYGQVARVGSLRRRSRPRDVREGREFRAICRSAASSSPIRSPRPSRSASTPAA